MIDPRGEGHKSRQPSASRAGSGLQQMSLLDLHECPLCKGAGVCYGRELDDADKCPMCRGSGTVEFDPSDETIPF